MGRYRGDGRTSRAASAPSPPGSAWAKAARTCGVSSCARTFARAAAACLVRVRVRARDRDRVRLRVRVDGLGSGLAGRGRGRVPLLVATALRDQLAELGEIESREILALAVCGVPVQG